jgi:hypothetical protein
MAGSTFWKETTSTRIKDYKEKKEKEKHNRLSGRGGREC